jgi:chromosome segregation ATPase
MGKRNGMQRKAEKGIEVFQAILDSYNEEDDDRFMAWRANKARLRKEKAKIRKQMNALVRRWQWICEVLGDEVG